MSGGHFNYKQYEINEIADQIESLINDNDKAGKEEMFRPETIAKFQEAMHCLRRAGEMVQRIDWLISSDDSEETFHERWLEEVRGKNE